MSVALADEPGLTSLGLAGGSACIAYSIACSIACSSDDMYICAKGFKV